MIQSMTGFGSGSARAGDEELRVEIRAVNHKYCEVKCRLPPELLSLEQELVKQVKGRVRRGSLDLTVRRGLPGRSVLHPRVDLDYAKRLTEEIRKLGEALGVGGELGVADVVRFDGVVALETRALDLEGCKAALEGATSQALELLLAMRAKEGEALAKDLRSRIALLRDAAKRIQVASPASIEAWRQRLEERIGELSKGIAVDPARLAQEVVLFADRVDIAEELTRLASHFGQFEEILGQGEPAGRRLEFLVQELQREVNTIGSKSQSVEISALVVEMKAEVERIREQIQNVE